MATFPRVPQFLEDGVQWMRLMANALNKILEGKINSTGQVTLTANQASTVVSDVRCGANTRVFIAPVTANASAEIASIYIPLATITDGQFTIQHANNGNTDKTFNYVLLG